MHDPDEVSGCGCGGGAACATMPAEFVRVRYYFGQRLGVLELGDEAMYHSGKLAFHNVRLHGSGVVCGLRVERMAPAVGTGPASTVLRVSRGAAIDPCGREIVVGLDQCIDIAAWFARNRARPALSGWKAGTTQRARLAVRYRECPSDPSPAPRDPCGCDNGGCEYGRVREGFELALFAEGEISVAATDFPDPAALAAALADAEAGDPADAVPRAVNRLVAADCPEAPDAPWLCLGDVPVTLGATAMPVDIGDPDDTIPDRRSLLSTRALQQLLLGQYGGGAGGSAGGAPQAGALSFVPDTTAPTTAGVLSLGITLAMAGTPPAPVPLVAPTLDPATVKVERLDTTAGWTDVTPPVAAIAYDDTATPPALRLTFTADLAAGPLYRLTIDPAFAAPAVDAAGHPLARLARHIRFVAVDAGGTLGLAPSA